MNAGPLAPQPDIIYESKSNSSLKCPGTLSGLRSAFTSNSTSKNQYVVPVNYSEDVSLVLDKYNYISPLFS